VDSVVRPQIVFIVAEFDSCHSSCTLDVKLLINIPGVYWRHGVY